MRKIGTLIVGAILALSAHTFGACYVQQDTLKTVKMRIGDRTTDYFSFNIVGDSIPKVVSPTIIELFFHIEVPNGNFGKITALGAHYVGLGSGTPIEARVNDSAGSGYTGFTKYLTGLTLEDTIVSTVFGYDTPTFTHEIVPYEIYWITVLDPKTGVPFTSEQKTNYLTVGPNPVSASTIISTPLWKGTILSVYDIFGREILTISATGESTQVEMQNLAKGMYIVTARNSNLQMKISTRFLKL